MRAADDGSAAFRIARALAGLRGTVDRALPIRAQIYPVQPTRNEWSDGADEATGRLRLHTDVRGTLPRRLIALLHRRLWLGEQLGMPDRPLASADGIDLDDLALFLSSSTHDARIAALLPALSLCRVPDGEDRIAGTASVPAGFALLRACLLPEAVLHDLGMLNEDAKLPTATGLLAQLVAGNTGNRAVQLAWRRLRASGLPLLPAAGTLPGLAGMAPERAAAALLIPLRFGAAAVLTRSVVRDNEHDLA